MAFAWELTEETIHLPLGCLQGGSRHPNPHIPPACSSDPPFRVALDLPAARSESSAHVKESRAHTHTQGDGDTLRGQIVHGGPGWFSRCGPFTQIGHIPGGGRPLLREGGPISYQPRPEATFPQVMEIHHVGSVCTADPDGTDYLPVRIYFIIVMIRWTGLAPWKFEFPFPGDGDTLRGQRVHGGPGRVVRLRRQVGARGHLPQPPAGAARPPQSIKSRLGREAFPSPPWRQPRGKWMVSLVNSHTNATSKR